MTRTIEINGVNLSITAITEKARKILLKKGPLKAGSESHSFALALLRIRRPNIVFPSKTQIKVDTGKDPVNNCFWYKNKENTWEDFSYKKAIAPESQRIENKAGSQSLFKKDVLEAFRMAVYYQIKSFREKEIEKHPKLKELSQKDPYNVHTDHIVPFHLLVSDFLRDKNMTLGDVKIKVKEVFGSPHKVLANESLKEEWESYHKEHARFQLLEAFDNLSKAGKYDIPLYHYKKKRQETYD